jgi:Big-like domain-containing protein
MRAITLSRTVAAFAVLTFAAACNDTSGPGGQGDLNTGGMSIVPRNAIIGAGQVVPLKATLIDEHGDRLDGVITWTSSNDAVATVSGTGEVFGRGAGHVVITASALGKSQFSTVRVLARSPKPHSGLENPDPKPSKKLRPQMEPARRLDR